MSKLSGVYGLALGVAGFAGLLTSPVAAAATLDDVRERDRLVCGVSEGLPGFSDHDDAGAWSGFDVDFCRAVAAAVLGEADKVDYVPLSATARFDALTAGDIDLLSRNSTWTMSRDLDLGIDFAGIAYYDGQGFLVQALDGMTSALELIGARICLVTGTTTEANAANYFASNNIEVSFLPFADRSEARAAYAAGECDAYTADSSALAAERSLLDVPDDHVILREVISKEPLGPVTREGDTQWTELVRWTLYGLINAEEMGLTAASVDPDRGDGASRDQAIALGAPAAMKLGLNEAWLATVLNEVGHYGEVFDRNLGDDTPLAIRRGVNALWTRGGILYAPPMY
ncbi:amino acid ABC transporter substrate-binding protein [Bauldia sp.]|uniref:amino acid ABC transporter substrate-binding protein n=1 Tax=Bauldia sp. TaxID=2575872 RepID=UPI003BADB627